MQWSNRTLAAGCRIGTADRVSPLDKSGVWADCIRRRKPVIHNEYKAVPGTQGYPQGHVPVIRELTVPVIDNGLVKAVLGVGNKKVIYSTHDRALVQELANMTWDIVVRKKIEDQWKALSRRLEIMVGNLPGMVYRCANDPDWTMEYVSQGCLDLTGYQTDDFTGKNPQMTFAGIIHAGHRHRVWDEIQEKISHGASFEIEYPIVHRDGTIRWVWERGVRVEGDDASPDCLEGFITDITHKRKQEAQLRQRAMVIDQAAESIMITDEKGDIQYVNPAFEQITGYPKEEVSGQNPRILKSGNQGTGFYRRLWETIRTGKTWRGRFVNRKKDGVLFTQEGTVTPVLDSSGQIVNYVAVMLDISEDILMEEQLSSAQRMEAIGTLAGGIAHDFNNILFPMVGLSELLQEDLPENSPLQDHVSGILKSGMRARDLVKQILSFSRQDKMEPKAVRLQMIVKEVLKLMRASLPSTITINEDVRDDCPPVLADPTQIHQIVMNLITNAFHAMEETGGELKITLTREKIEAVKIDNFKGSIKEDGVCITVSDTGKGMEKDVCDRIFEPYFTTKAKGKGTGLGLSVVHGIVEKHDGFIRVESRPGSGTTFRIILPCLTDTSSLDAPHEGQGVQGGTERILLVDDEAPIISMVKQQLERMGYRVTARTASLDAIEIFKKQPDRFDLVITDLTMPNMTGDRLTRKIKQVRPDIPVILCTGFSDKINPEKAAAMGIDAYILKPVIRKDIDAAIRRVLNKKVGAVL
jgi:PAS domain S-box-containing protein